MDLPPEAVAAAGVPGPALLVVGEVVRLAERIAWFGADPQTSPQQERIR